MISTTEKRKFDIFQAIVREYQRTAEPVASGTIVSRYDLGVSPATVRNDMAELEEEGFLEQPHTSAGRIPSEQGYRLYVREFVREKSSPSAQIRRQLAEVFAVMEERERMYRDLVRAVAAMTDETVFASLDGRMNFFGGMSNILRKPELRMVELMTELTSSLDALDEIVGEMRPQMTSTVEIRIGAENPFGRELSVVMTSAGSGVVGILGPKRMDYDANVALMRYVHEMLSRN